MIIDVENGHTLHLVERQPAPSQPSSGPGTGETAGNDGNRGWFSGKVSFPLYWVWAGSLKWKPSLVKLIVFFFFFFHASWQEMIPVLATLVIELGKFPTV